jgi:hypothetical protein
VCRRFVRAIERRKRRVYVPRAVALVQALRTFVNGPIFEALMIRASKGQIEHLENEVRALGRSFGEHSMGHGTSRNVT